jgi:ATP-dependent protease ClpP protease subunit
MLYDIGSYKSQDIGVVAALLLAAGKRGKRYTQPHARIMIH